MPPLVTRHPQGTWAIQCQGLYMCDPGIPWHKDPREAVRFRSKEDATAIADGLWHRRTVMGGVATYSLANGQPQSRLSVVEIV